MLCVLAAISFTGLLRSHASGREVLGWDTSAATVFPDCANSLSCSKQCTNWIGVSSKAGWIVQEQHKPGVRDIFLAESPGRNWSGVFKVRKITLKICKAMSEA